MIGFESRLETEVTEDKKDRREGEERFGETYIPKEELLDMKWKEIGVNVTEPRDREYDELAYKAATICRRRFSAYEAVLISKLDEQMNGDAGIAFTSNAIYYWTQGDKFGFSIGFKDIEEVDFSSEGVLITVTGESAEQMYKSNSTHYKKETPATATDCEPVKTIRTLYCTSNAMQEADAIGIIRNMYYFISDIVDYSRRE